MPCLTGKAFARHTASEHEMVPGPGVTKPCIAYLLHMHTGTSSIETNTLDAGKSVSLG